MNDIDIKIFWRGYRFYLVLYSDNKFISKTAIPDSAFVSTKSIYNFVGTCLLSHDLSPSLVEQFKPKLRRARRKFLSLQQHLQQEQNIEFDSTPDMATPIVGWKVLFVSSQGLYSGFDSSRWTSLMPFEASCAATEHRNWTKRWGHNLPCPEPTCSCGIYVVDNLLNIPPQFLNPRAVICKVFGWGRYVRHESGWRCQFAYPGEIHLFSGFPYHSGIIQELKIYRVPIFHSVFIYEPIEMTSSEKLYDPEEDGYEFPDCYRS